MADEEHLAIMRQGLEAWDVWRKENPRVRPNLTGADLSGADLSGFILIYADLSGADLTNADLSETYLANINLSGADLTAADLSKADLSGANLADAYLVRADLSGANLTHADFVGAILAKADLSGAHLFATVFGQADLGCCKGLETCLHVGPSIIDFETLRRSWPLPQVFLRGVGLPDNLIVYLPSLLSQTIQMYSCFISYSSRDEEFAQRLHADLQNKGVRCWFAPHDLPIGAKILDALDEAIRLRDKLLLVLSEHAIASDWVEDEVTAAFEEERTRKGTVLFPIRLDDAVVETKEAWAAKLRARNIGDFRRWKEHDAYHKALERLLRDLRVKAG